MSEALAVGWFLLDPLGEAVTEAGDPASLAGDGLAGILIDADAVNAVLAIAFCLGVGTF